MQDAKKFFNTIFEETCDGKIMLWTLPDKKSYFFDDPDTAGEAAVNDYNGHDVYFGVGISRKATSTGTRGKTDNILAMPTLVADIDVDAEGVDSKKPRFKDKKTALSFLESLPLAPTIIIWSGGGLHAYWCFKEPFEINSKQDSVEILKLSKGWSGFIQKEALKLGVIVDSVWDITRVLRVPGTNNFKTGLARPVTIVSLDSKQKYNPDSFEDYLCYDKVDYGVVVESKKFGSLVLSPAAKPPLEQFEALLANNPDFEEAFRRTKKTGDQSASAYDMALANHAAIAGWEPQDICNLLIFSRQKHGDDLKLRESYYATTIARAMAPRDTDNIVSDIETLVESAQENKKDQFDKATLPEESAPDAIATLSKLLRVPVQSFHQHGSTQHATFTVLYTTGGTDSFTSASQFYSQKTWLNIADVQGAEDRPPLKPKEWSKVKDLIKAIITQHDDEEYSERSQTAGWIKAFIGGKLYSAEEVGDYNLPFKYNQAIYLRVNPFLVFLQRSKMVPSTFTNQALGGRLNAIGFKTKITKTPINKAKTVRFKVCYIEDLLELANQ